jgi:hypothetical protein
MCTIIDIVYTSIQRIVTIISIRYAIDIYFLKSEWSTMFFVCVLLSFIGPYTIFCTLCPVKGAILLRSTCSFQIHRAYTQRSVAAYFVATLRTDHLKSNSFFHAGHTQFSVCCVMKIDKYIISYRNTFNYSLYDN